MRGIGYSNSGGSLAYRSHSYNPHSSNHYSSSSSSSSSSSASSSSSSFVHKWCKCSPITAFLMTVLFVTVSVQLCWLFVNHRPAHPSLHGVASIPRQSGKTFPPQFYENGSNNIGVSATTHEINEKESPVRVAVIVIYVGSSLPVWFDAFAHTAAQSHSHFEWLLFTTRISIKVLPRNVKIIQLTDEQLFTHFAKLVEGPFPSPFENYNPVKVIQQLLTTKSYSMVEFKPTLGHLFSEYLESYTHWAYADIDQLLGRMDALIPPSVLNEYDIYSSTFGDNFRFYMRGQLTIHKNIPKVTQLWRGCAHFTSFKELLVEFLTSGNRTWHFESAEGCYSKVVALHAVDSPLNEQNEGAHLVDFRTLGIDAEDGQEKTSVYFGATQATDAFGAPFTDRESIVFGNHLVRCHGNEMHRAYTDEDARKQHALLESLSNEEPPLRAGIENSKSGPVLSTTDVAFRAVGFTKYRCSYWVKESFEVCIDRIPPYADIQIKKGIMKYQDVDRYQAFNGTCREAAISHFQAWKHNYLQSTTRPAPADTHALVLSEYGFIPYRLPNPPVDISSVGHANTRSDRSRHSPRIKTFSELLTDSGNAHSVAYGRLTPALVSALYALEYHQSQQQKGPSHSTLLTQLLGVSSVADTSALPLSHTASAYCGAFARDLGKCVCTLMFSHVKVVHNPLASSSNSFNSAENGKQKRDIKAGELTYVTVGWAEDYYAGRLMDTINAWGEGHKIIVLATMGDAPSKSSSSFHKHPEDLTVIEVSFGSCSRFIHKNQDKHPYLPEKLLYNIALDAAPSDIVCIVPAGVVLDLPAKVPQKLLIDELNELTDYVHGVPAVVVFPVFIPLPPALARNANSTSRSEEPTTKLVAYPFYNVTEQVAALESVDYSKERHHGSSSAAVSRLISCSAVASDQSNQLLSTNILLPSTSSAATSTMMGNYQAKNSLVARVIGQQHQRLPSSFDAKSRVLLRTANEETSEIGHTQGAGEGVDEVERQEQQEEEEAEAQGLGSSITNQRIKFHASELLRAETLLLPVLYNVSASPHGTGFTRFPEELSGVGCHGSTFLRSLVGSGYTLVWANVIGLYTHLKGDNEVATLDRCGCAYGDEEHRDHAIDKINKFYLRAVHVRKYGLQGIHARLPFGSNFAAEQKALMEEAEK